MIKHLCLLVCLGVSVLLSGQSPIGIWKSVDDTDNVEKSHIEVYEENGKLYGKVVKLLPAATILTCNKCKGDKKGKPLLNMVILRDMEPKGEKWDGGRILDPAKGKEYKCVISLDGEDKLKVRGYIGKPLFGRTQYWYRVK